ncbi:WD40 repeat-like protein [Trametes maxima]|nr:WD40 repeat-like protein [Trametes maxima]
MAHHPNRAWDIYADLLLHHGHGYPLWMPDPDNSEWEVEIGDVGWLRGGSFKHILRTRRGPGEPQPHGATPVDYVPFNPPNLVITGPRERIVQPVLYSRTIKNVQISGGASVTLPTAVPVAPGGNITFTCSEDSGALLVLSPKGEEIFIESRRHIVTHLRENLDKWERLANDTLGLELKQEDIYFVCGVTKTCRWAVAAFHGSQRGAEGSVSCDFGALASANFSVNISNVSIPSGWYRNGPPHARRYSTQSLPQQIGTYGAAPSVHGYSSGSASTSAESLPYWSGPGGAMMPPPPSARQEKADQCVFFHYYKMKRRWLLPRKIEAGAGPHQLPPDPGNADTDSDVLASEDGGLIEDRDIEMVPNYPPSFDPVNVVLDYIIQNSEAEVAIASDLDLYALFKDQEFPRDIAAAVLELRPGVDVDESGVGMLSVEITYNRKRAPEEECEGSPNKKRAVPGNEGPKLEVDDIEPMEIDPSLSTSSRGAEGGGGSGSPQAPLMQAHTSATADDVSTEAKDNDALRIVMGDSNHEGSVTALVYSADGKFLATGSEDTSIIIWNAHDNSMKRKIAGHEDTVPALAFNMGGNILASISDFGPIKLWTIDMYNAPPQELDTDMSFRSIAFTPDGSKLLAGASDGTLVVWNLGNMERFDIRQHSAVVTFIIFSADGRMMATGGTENTCCIWEVDKIDQLRPQWRLEGHRGMITSASFTADGRRIVTGADDCVCRIWSTETGQELVYMYEHVGPVWSVAFSPDGKRVASGSSDSTVKVCDAWTGQRLLSLDGHDGMVNCVVYSPDGRHIASASADTTVRLWNAADGTCALTYNEHGDNVTSLLFSPDGRTLASGSHDGTVFVRTLPSEEAA